MQPIQRDPDLHRKPGPFQIPEVRRPTPSLGHGSEGGVLHGPGGGSVDALSNTFSGLAESQLPGAAGKAPAPAPKPTPGLYPGVTDLTGQYGALAHGKRASTQGVVLHRTENESAAQTLSGYSDRIKKGSSIGAQYLIDEKGGTSLITPLDGMASHSSGFSATTVGVEVVGPAQKFDRSGTHGSIRDQVNHLNLSPEFRQRLLGYNDKQLSNVAKWNGDQIYEDISGAQKRSVWNLSNHLATEYGLDMSSLSHAGKDESGANNYTRATLPDFSAHEHINPKALGEGEPMIEFLRARQQYPQLIAQAEKKLAQLRAAGADPQQLAHYEALVKQEQGTLGALNLDGNAAETAALKAEQTAGKPGEATEREHQRTDFYDHFYDRIGALKSAVK